jgi:hypothetical protein
MNPTPEDGTPEQPPDPMAEIKAMTGVVDALKGLAPRSIEHVLEWANKHYLGRVAPVVKQRPGSPGAAAADIAAVQGDGERVDFPTFLSSARASTAVDRALLAGYYFQQILRQADDFDSFSLNRELKNAGHASGNITRDLDALIAKTPQLVMQTRKHGTSKQARKLYRLTAAGLTAARAMTGAAATIE